MDHVSCMKIFTAMLFIIKSWERVDKLWCGWANNGILQSLKKCIDY